MTHGYPASRLAHAGPAAKRDRAQIDPGLRGRTCQVPIPAGRGDPADRQLALMARRAVPMTPILAVAAISAMVPVLAVTPILAMVPVLAVTPILPCRPY